MTKLEVVDGDHNADSYGAADNDADALAIAQLYFTDHVIGVAKLGPITMADGTILPLAYVAFTSEWVEA